MGYYSTVTEPSQNCTGTNYPEIIRKYSRRVPIKII